MATEKTMPPLPSGSFDLNKLLKASDIDAEIKKQIAANTPAEAKAEPSPDAKNGE